MTLAISDLETARFGIVAARLVDPAAALDVVNAQARNMGVQMITSRVEANNFSRIHALEADGYRLMDTLVYYTRSLLNIPEMEPRHQGLCIRAAVPDDAPAVAEVARAAFQGYFGHYHADPRLDNLAADAAYVEWAETTTLRSTPKAPVLLAMRGDEIIGFATVRLNSPEEAEGVLFGIDPSAQRGGLYSALIVRALCEGRRIKANRMIVSTQITNAAVQRVWARKGFVYDRAIYTFHKWF
jgi:GNAT superfamily N-acetyltransferase